MVTQPSERVRTSPAADTVATDGASLIQVTGRSVIGSPFSPRTCASRCSVWSGTRRLADTAMLTDATGGTGPAGSASHAARRTTTSSGRRPSIDGGCVRALEATDDVDVEEPGAALVLVKPTSRPARHAAGVVARPPFSSGGNALELPPSLPDRPPLQSLCPLETAPFKIRTVSFSGPPLALWVSRNDSHHEEDSCTKHPRWRGSER